MTADAPTPGRWARRLMREVPRAALGTLMATGEPYVSLAMVAVDHGAAPLLLLSDLADHSRNLAADPRASLLLDGTSGDAIPLAGARVSVQGTLRPVEPAAREALLARYVARHADAAQYAGFADFRLYRLAVARGHLVAGFGRIHWIDAADLLLDTRDSAALAEREADIVGHMNDDHADAVALYATRLLDRPPGDWRMTGIDPEGADLACGVQRARLWFEQPALDADQARLELVRLVRLARATAPAAGRHGSEDRA